MINSYKKLTGRYLKANINGKTKKKYVGPVANLKVGDELELQYMDYRNGEPPEFGKGQIKKVKIAAILSSDPFDFYGSSSGLKLITTEEAAKSLI
jgi:putative ABC transport system permease protein